jgi:hypothetical protein
MVSEETGYALLEDMFTGLPAHQSLKDIIIYSLIDDEPEEYI